MKKLIAIAMAGALSLTLLAGCGGGGENNTDKKNTKPTIEGVQEAVSIEAGQEFDALKGVTATDKEDGDLTSKIDVSAEGLTFTGGKTTPAEAGTYDVIYTVEDKGGLKDAAYCTLSVTPAAAAAVEAYKADFSDLTAADADYHYWAAEVDESAQATATLKEGNLVFDIEKNAANDDQLKLTRTFDNLGAGHYEFIVYLSSTVATKVNLNALLQKDGADWNTQNLGGGVYNAEVGTEMTAVTLAFDLDDAKLTEGKASVLFRVCLGGTTGDANNPRPEKLSVSINRLAIYKTTGSNEDISVYENDFSEEGDVSVGAVDGAAANVTYDTAAKEAKINVTSYNTTGGVWSLTASIALTNAKIKLGTKYRYEIVMCAESLTAGELICSIAENKDDRGRNFIGKVNIKTEDTTLTGTFDASFASEAAAFHLQFGRPEGTTGPATNVITVKSVKLYEVHGDLETSRVSYDKFTLFGAASSHSADKTHPYDVFNGDEGNSKIPGVGAAYVKDGKLIYRIYEGGEADYQSKLAIGFGENGIALPANGYYTFVIKVKASKALKTNFYVHELGTEWDSGLIVKCADFDKNALEIGTEETTIEIKTAEPIFTESSYELLFQFGSASLAALGEVTVEISEITVLFSALA